MENYFKYQNAEFYVNYSQETLFHRPAEDRILGPRVISGNVIEKGTQGKN